MLPTPVITAKKGDRCFSTYKGTYYKAKIVKIMPGGKEAKIKFDKWSFFTVVAIDQLKFPVITPRTAKVETIRKERAILASTEVRTKQPMV